MVQRGVCYNITRHNIRKNTCTSVKITDVVGQLKDFTI